MCFWYLSPSAPMDTSFTPLLVMYSRALFTLAILWKRIFPLSGLGSLSPEGQQIRSNQIKSNHFYCHITTAQVPWWVKFLRACSRQCKKTKQFTYRQYIFTDCTEDNVQNTHTHTQYTQCTIKTYLVTNTPYVHILHYVHICEGATDYTFTTD